MSTHDKGSRRTCVPRLVPRAACCPDDGINLIVRVFCLKSVEVRRRRPELDDGYRVGSSDRPIDRLVFFERQADRPIGVLRLRRVFSLDFRAGFSGWRDRE
jgi:hypothetical protein